jgi:hypothetical protein
MTLAPLDPFLLLDLDLRFLASFDSFLLIDGVRIFFLVPTLGFLLP